MVTALHCSKMIGKDNHSIDHTPEYKRRNANKTIIKIENFMDP